MSCCFQNNILHISKCFMFYVFIFYNWNLRKNKAFSYTVTVKCISYWIIYKLLLRKNIQIFELKKLVTNIARLLISLWHYIIVISLLRLYENFCWDYCQRTFFVYSCWCTRYIYVTIFFLFSLFLPISLLLVSHYLIACSCTSQRISWQSLFYLWSIKCQCNEETEEGKWEKIMKITEKIIRIVRATLNTKVWLYYDFYLFFSF